MLPTPSVQLLVPLKTDASTNLRFGLSNIMPNGYLSIITDRYSRKIVGIGPLYEPTGNPGQDLAAIRGFYDPRWARYPERV